MKLIIPILIVILANTFYHIVSKSTPSDANSFGTLTITYLVAAAVSAIIFVISCHGKNLVTEISKSNWTSVVLGFIIIGLEFGWMFAYRSGWEVSKANVVGNICLAVILIFVGLFMFKEKITPQKIIGILVCIAGLVIINA